MVGTFGGALAARKIDPNNKALTANVRGEVESEDGVLVIKRIHVAHKIKAATEARETIERVHGIYANKCPIYVSLRKAIEITSSYELI
jgi:uncharacterized OsmC-like protein